MAEQTLTLVERINARFGAKILASTHVRDHAVIDVASEAWVEVSRALRDDAEFRFEQLIDVCGVDYLSYGQVEWDTQNVSNEGFSRGVEGAGPGRFAWANRPATPRGEGRFGVVVHLLSVHNNRRLRLRTRCADDSLPVVGSLVDVWPVANWFEREAFDLFGIVFEGHPDLRRILTDYGFVGHPFRKDFPLIGNVEVRVGSSRVDLQACKLEYSIVSPK